MKSKLITKISAALRFGHIDAFFARLPGAPNISLLKRSRALDRYRQAVEMAKLAEKMRTSAIQELTEELLEDWSEADITKALE